MSNPVYPTKKIEVQISNIWEDLSGDLIGTPECYYGIPSNTPNDRIAGVGILRFTLRNDDSCSGGVNGWFSPYTTGSKSGWRTGLPVRLSFTYLDQTSVKFYGHISDISPESGNVGTRRVNITVLDYMDYLINFPIVLPPLQFNKRIEEVAAAILALVPIQPLATQYGTGTDTFPTVFDTVKNTGTRALSEMQKLALSELGFIYVKRDKTYGETFCVEGRHTRNSNSAILKVPIPTSVSGFIKCEDGTFLLNEDGTYLKLDELQDMIFDNNMMNLSTSNGTNKTNYIDIKVYPRIVDNVDQVIFSMASSLYIPAGTSKSFSSNYKDPVSNAKSVFMKSYVNPAATTDYLMFANADGTGTNLTANLSLTGTVYSPGNVVFTLSNTSGTNGYVTKLQIRGKGIYIYDAKESVHSDATSYNTYGYIPLTLDMPYQSDVSTADAMGIILLAANKDPKLVANTVSFLANESNELMQAFLYSDIGDMIFLQESQSKAYGNFYINNVSFTVSPGGIVNYTWGLRDALSLLEIYWHLDTVGQSELGTTTILGY